MLWCKSLVSYFFSYFVINFNSLFKLFDALIHWLLKISCLDKKGVLLERILDKRIKNNILLFSRNLCNCPSFFWLFTEKIKIKSELDFYNALILYILKAYFFNSQVNFCCFFYIIFNLFLYFFQNLFSLYLFYFISIFKTPKLIAFCPLNFLFS